MSSEQYQYIILGMIFTGNLIIFLKYYFQSPFFNETIGKVWTIFSAINFWTALMLNFAKVIYFYRTLFNMLIIFNLKFFTIIFFSEN